MVLSEEVEKKIKVMLFDFVLICRSGEEVPMKIEIIGKQKLKFGLQAWIGLFHMNWTMIGLNWIIL